MTKAEILDSFKQLPTEERLEVIEAASRMMREEIEAARLKAERKKRLRAAAEEELPRID